MSTNRIEIDHIILKYKTEADWLATDPVILEGEFAVVLDRSGNYKMGDGVKKFSELPYSIGLLTGGLSIEIDDSKIVERVTQQITDTGANETTTDTESSTGTDTNTDETIDNSADESTDTGTDEATV